MARARSFGRLRWLFFVTRLIYGEYGKIRVVFAFQWGFRITRGCRFESSTALCSGSDIQ